MRYLLPRPLPDELLSSVWVRLTRRAGLPIGAVTRALTNRKWSPGFFQAGHLDALAPLLGMTTRELLWTHTVFPYATAFFEPPVFGKALAAALSTGTAAVGMGAVTQSVSGHVPFRRFCLDCAREEVKRWGESFWHRAHNLPGVLVCLQHGRVLRESALRTAGVGSWSDAVPHELTGVRAFRGKARAFDIELAHRSVVLLHRAEHGHQGRSSAWYRVALAHQGLVSPHRQVNVAALSAWVAKAAGSSAVRYGFSESDARLGWLGLMVRLGETAPFVPLKHSLFETALTVAGTTGAPLLDHKPSGPSGRPRDELDRQYAAAVKQVVQGYAKRGERVRICDALTEAGCWSAVRHCRTAFPLIDRAVKRLRMSSTSARPVLQGALPLNRGGYVRKLVGREP